MERFQNNMAEQIISLLDEYEMQLRAAAPR
jgi:hypothetical protein